MSLEKLVEQHRFYHVIADDVDFALFIANEAVGHWWVFNEPNLRCPGLSPAPRVRRAREGRSIPACART